MCVALRRSLAEVVPKERAGGLPVFAAALRALPYVIPDQWEGARLAEELPGAYTPTPTRACHPAAAPAATLQNRP